MSCKHLEGSSLSLLGDNLDTQCQAMSTPLNRRHFLLGTAASALAVMASGCDQRRSSQRTAQHNPASTSAPRSKIHGYTYTVARGDTLSSISRRSRLSVSTIIRVNDLASNAIFPGMLITLPGVSYMGKDPLSIPDEPIEETISNYDYRIVRRSSWTKQSVRSNNRILGSVNRITIHHTGEHGDIAKLPDLEVVKRIENYHRNERKWAAIGYHFLIGRNGIVYEGRPARYQGAHTRSNNRNNLGISMIGDFNKRKPGGVQLSALESLINDKRSKYNVRKRNVFGHRDLSPSVCPGKYLYAWLQTYKTS